MPIYEFYCPHCNTIFNFLSRRINTVTCPSCPSCRRSLRREVSPFAAPRKRSEGATADGDADDTDFPVDEQRLEQAMSQMAGDIEHLNEDDPQQAAQLMRKFSDMTGMRFNRGIEEAISRMEAGEDPEAVEAEMGDALEEEEPFIMDGAGPGGTGRRRPTAPRRDPVLYDMPAP